MKKRILSLILCLCLALSLLPGAVLAAGGQYDDVAGHWAESSIERWSGYGILQGSSGHFRPDAPLTRGEMAAILSNTLGLTDEGLGNPFADVSADAWYAPYVLRCYTAGIMKGDGVNARPTATITRQEAIVMMCRALGIPEKPNADLSAYGDGSGVASWARGALAAMIDTGIVGGVGNNQLAPTAEINRASTVTILDRAIVQYINTPGTHTLTDRDGIILVAAAGNVTLTGKTSADILVTPAGQSRTLTFDKADVTGTITVQADNMKITTKDSNLPAIVTVGDSISVEDANKPAIPTDGKGGNGSSSSGGNSDSKTPSVTLSARATGEGGKLAVGDALTATVRNADGAELVWNIGGFDQEFDGDEYTVTSADMGKEIFVKLVKDGETVAESSKKYTVVSSTALDMDDTAAPVVMAENVTYKDENGNFIDMSDYATRDDTTLLLSVELKPVTDAEETTTKGAVKDNIETNVQNAIAAVDSSIKLTVEQKAELAAATEVKAVDVDLTLVTTTTDETGATTTEETKVHPVGQTTVRLSAAQLGMAGEDLNLYHFVASHTNKDGVHQTVTGTVDAKGETVTFVTNGLSTIWIGNVPPRTVTFNTLGGTAVEPQRVRFGSTVDTGKVGTPTRTGYIFCGWNYDLAKTPIISNMTVTAQWVEGAIVPTNRYSVTLSEEPASLTKTTADGEYTLKANPEATYAADITASVSVTPYPGAVKYLASTSAETAAGTTDPAQFTAINGAGSIAMTPVATVTNSEGNIVAGRTSYYIKWVGEQGDVLALEEIVVVVNDGQGAAETKVVTRDINRGVGTFDPYLTSSTKTDAPNWVGYINGDPERQYSTSSDEWDYRLRTNVRFENRFSRTDFTEKDYDTLNLDFTPFTGESYSGKSVSAVALHYVSETHQRETVNATAKVNSDGHLMVSLPVTSFTEPDTSYNIYFDVQVTVGDVTQLINVGTRNPKYQDDINNHEDVSAANMTELKSALNTAASKPNTRYNIDYTGEQSVTLTESLTIPSNVGVYFVTDFTVGNGGVLTMESAENRASNIYIYDNAFTVADGGKLIAFDTRTGEQNNIWVVGIHADAVTVADGGSVEIKPHSILDFYGGGNQSSLCTLSSGSQVMLTSSDEGGGHFNIGGFDSVSLDGSISADRLGYLYVYSDTILVGGTIDMGGDIYNSVEFYGDVTVLETGKIQISGVGANLNMQCPLTNKGEITLTGGAYGILTNTGFTQHNSGTISIASGCVINVEGTKLVNTGTITGDGSVFAMLGDDITDYAANHTGLEYVEVSGQQTPDNYSRYKFTGEPAETIDVTLYKGEISSEQGGTVGRSITVDTEEFPEN